MGQTLFLLPWHLGGARPCRVSSTMLPLPACTGPGPCPSPLHPHMSLRCLQLACLPKGSWDKPSFLLGRLLQRVPLAFLSFRPSWATRTGCLASFPQGPDIPRELCIHIASQLRELADDAQMKCLFFANSMSPLIQHQYSSAVLGSLLVKWVGLRAPYHVACDGAFLPLHVLRDLGTFVCSL